MIERRIKDLSFALEALSRVNSYNAMGMRDDVEQLLIAEIAVAKKQQEERAVAAKTDPMDQPFTEPAKNIDDEIPF